MTKFISLNKLSAKKRKATISANRRTWGFNPVTRVKPSGKTYNRKRTRRTEYNEYPAVSFSLPEKELRVGICVVDV